MIDEEVKKFEPFFGKWYIEGSKPLGGGSYGTVYKIKREEFGEVYYSALKVISIPRDKTELNEATLFCGTIQETMTYFDNIRQSIVKEINIMERFKGKTNVVSYEDHDIRPKNNGETPGYDIFIRMELLESLQDFVFDPKNRALFWDDNKEIVKIGKDICSALKLCHAQNIIHRDIKRGNIFRSIDGDYKLGDFGIARNFDDSNLTMSVKGTYDYMAPEVYNHEHYDFRADIYSLGILLYDMLNGFRGPFLPNVKGRLTQEQREQALMTRMQGQELPKPMFAFGKLADIILKACAFSPNNRFSTIEEFQEALNSLTEADFSRSEEEYIDKEEGETVILDVQELEEEGTVALNVQELEEEGTVALNVQELEEEGTVAFNVQEIVEEEGTIVFDVQEIEEEGTIAFDVQEIEEEGTVAFDAQEIVEEEKKKEEKRTNIEKLKEKETKEKVEQKVVNKEERPKNNKVIPFIAVGAVAVIGATLIFGGSSGKEEQKNQGAEIVQTLEELEQEEEQKEVVVEQQVEEEPEIIVYKPVIVEEVVTKAVNSGKVLEKVKIVATFQKSSEDTTIVEGILEWKDKDIILEKSGEYEWIFLPTDTVNYEKVEGTAWVTVLCTETITGMEAIKAIEDKKSLVDVDLSNCDLENLDILEGAENLKYISLDGNNLTSLEVLKKCKNLHFISLVDNKELSDITPILKLKKLQAVFLDGTNVSAEDVQKVKNILVQ